MSAHASQAFSIAHCTDSEDLPSSLLQSFRSFSTLKSIELLTGSGEVLVYYIQWWRHHFESGRAGDKFASGASKHFLTAGFMINYECISCRIKT